MYTTRIFFEKSGQARYISHLDLMRCFERALRRADIPFWYTEGFNPRPFLTFALPLSLGTTGLREVVDIRLTEEGYPLEKVTERLNACLPTGLQVLETALPVAKPKDIAASVYSISIECESVLPDVLVSALESFLSKDSIVITKLNKKKKPVETDLRPMIKSFSVQAGERGARLDITLSSGCTENCNPALVLDAFAAEIGVQHENALLECDYTRTAILDGELKAFA